MPRKIKPEHPYSEFWVVDSVDARRYDAEVTLRDLYCYAPTDDETADWPEVPPGTKGAECNEHTEHSITLPVSSQTHLRPGMHVRVTIEEV